MIYMNKNILIRIIILIVILSVVFIPKLFSKINSKDLINDYYSYVNSKYIEENPIENGTYGWSMIDKYQDEVNKDVDDIAYSLIDKNENVKIIYGNYLNIKERNNLGIKPLQKYINGINKSNNIDELIDEIYKLEDDLKISLLTTIKISKDFKDSSKYIIYLYPIMFDFDSDPTMYSNSDYDSYEAIIQKYLNRLLKIYGYDVNEARKIANEILDMKRDISEKSKKADDYIDIISSYNKITKEELQQVYSNINIDKYFDIKNINNREYSIVDIENYKAFNSYLTNENLELLKNYFICRLLENYSEILSEEYAENYYNFTQELQTTQKEFDINEQAKDLIITVFSDVIEEEYAKKYFSESDKDYISNMTDEIIDYYKKDINSLDWMSKETKEKALLKLNNIKVNIGLNNHEIYSDKYNLKESNSLFDNFKIITEYMYNVSLSYLDDSSKEIRLLNTYTVNAFYNPQDNSINFPCAAIKFKNSDDYFDNLGSIGMVIAHEITHAFDNNGRKFNENGEYFDWWTKKDSDSFDKLSERIIDYYSDYSVLGIPVDGRKTLGENIADLGALKCISSLAETHKAKNEDYKRMFSSYAKWTAYNYKDEIKKLLVTSDSHSPNEVRVNAVLSSTDKFYEVYNLKQNDKMYKNKKERVGIW